MRRTPLPVVSILLCVAASFLSLACGGLLAPAPELRSAWSEYYSTLVDVRSRLQQSRYFDTPVAQAEAYRYLIGLISLHNRVHVHSADPMHPVFFRWVAPDSDWGFSNPDKLYLAAHISGDGAYRIRGRLGTASETTLGCDAADTRDAWAGPRIRGADLEVGADGEFELLLSAEPREGNWLPLDPRATRVTIYQTFTHWDRESRGDFRIERVGEAGRAPAPLEPGQMAKQLTTSARALRRYANAWLDVADMISLSPVNTLPQPNRLRDAPTAAWSTSGHYALAVDQALIVEVPAPEAARYWGWSLYNAWSETLDYANRQTSLNHSQARVDADGVVRLVLAAQDPGVPNWLDTSAHPRGFLVWRVHAERAPAQPTLRPVAIAEVPAALPAGTPHISPDERRAAVTRRQQHVARRYAN